MSPFKRSRFSIGCLPFLLLAGCFSGAGHQDATLAADEGAGSENQGNNDATSASADDAESAGGAENAGAGEGGATDQAEGVPLSEYPELYAEAVCASVMRCQHLLVDVFGSWDCVGNVQAYIEAELPFEQRAIDERRSFYDGTKVEACATALLELSCAEIIGPDPEVCQAVFQGTVPVGRACEATVECEGDAFCDFFSGECPGSCKSPILAGGTCTYDMNCARGLVCSDESHTCVRPGAEGDLCLGGEPDCALGSWCIGFDSETPGICVAHADIFDRAQGVPCDFDDDQYCEPGLACVVESNVGGVRIASCQPTVGHGSSCRESYPDQCPLDEYCAHPDGGLEGRCEPLPSEGEACEAHYAAEPYLCDVDLVCDAGICRRLSSLGESCTSSDTCLSGRCEQNVCVPSLSCIAD